MCMALLALDRRYSDIRPRRPEGGPDGGRDLEAKRDGSLVWVAIGFQNSVNDSPQQLRAAKRKFMADLDAALGNEPSLKGFAFFTNVDLRPADQEELVTKAKERGVGVVDLYWRERIRALLDSTEGLGIRFQYLDISLSDAEQKAFFGRFGADLQDVITRQHETVERGLARLEFLHAMSRPLLEFGLELSLKKPFTAEELGHFRMALELQMVDSPRPWWYLAGRDRYDGTGPVGRTSYFWRGNDSSNAVKIGGGVAQNPVWSLIFGVGFLIEEQRATPEILDRSAIHVYVTERLASQASRLRVFANGYDLFRADLTKAKTGNWRPHSPWPEALADEENAEKWVGYESSFWMIDLDRTSPKSR